MRKNIAIALALPLTMSACSTATVYESASSKLLEGKWRGSAGLSGQWYPIGNAVTPNLTDEEKRKRDAVLSSCISQLNAEIKDTPRRYGPTELMAAAELATCMNKNGWRFLVAEIVIVT